MVEAEPTARSAWRNTDEPGRPEVHGPFWCPVLAHVPQPRDSGALDAGGGGAVHDPLLKEAGVAANATLRLRQDRAGRVRPGWDREFHLHDRLDRDAGSFEAGFHHETSTGEVGAICSS